jgi:hypothetical protein
MKFYILAMILALTSDMAFAQSKQLVVLSGSIKDSKERDGRPLAFAKVKICSTTRNVPCNEHTANEEGIYSANEAANDTYNIYVNGVIKTSIEVEAKNLDVPPIIIPSGGGGRRHIIRKALK